jgi:glycosyltransferase involved in cell wall biosynthesis
LVHKHGSPPAEVLACIPPYRNHRQPWELVCYSVMQLPPPTAGKRSVVWTMWESTRLPIECVKRLNCYDLVLVPSAWCATVFSASGVDVPIRVVPLGIDTDVFCPGPMPSLEEGFIFGTAAGVPQSPERKGFQRVVKAFKATFAPGSGAKLRVKGMPGEPLATDQGHPDIEVVKEFFPTEKLADWYRGLHVFVSDSAGEGWGLMQQQALACGVPLIAAPYGGIMEFFAESAGWRVPWSLRPGTGPYEGHGCQAEMDGERLTDAMASVSGVRGSVFETKRDHARFAGKKHPIELSLGLLLRTLAEEGFSV